MRVTSHHGRGWDRHNNRDFDVSKAKHINPAKTPFNLCWTNETGWVKQAEKPDFREVEKEKYKVAFGKALDEQNARYRKKRQYSRVRDLHAWMTSRDKGIRESILQIGNKDDRVSLETFKECFKEYFDDLRKWSRAHGSAVYPLDVAIHVDEDGGSVHAHLRYAFAYWNKEKSQWEPNMSKALEQAGVGLVDPDKPQDRFNNRQMKFDEMRREMWMSICEKHGIEVEREPDPTRSRHMPKKEYIAYAKKMEAVEDQDWTNKKNARVNEKWAKQNEAETNRLQRWEKQLHRTGALANGRTLEPPKGPQSGLGR